MSIGEILDGSTILNLVENDEAFNTAIHRRFAQLDIDQDGFLSYEEMLKELKSLRLLDANYLDADFNVEEKSKSERAQIYDSIFKLFDHDSNGKIDFEEYKSETKKIMLAIADASRAGPLEMLLQEDSLIKLAVENGKKVSS